jgi:hypothetical protein
MRGLCWIALGTPQARANLSNGSLGLERLLHPPIAQHASAKGKIHVFQDDSATTAVLSRCEHSERCLATSEPSIAVSLVHFPFSLFHFPRYSIPMPEHIEDIQHRYIDLKKRMELVRSYL